MILSYDNDTSPIDGGKGKAGESPMRSYGWPVVGYFGLFQPGAIVLLVYEVL